MASLLVLQQKNTPRAGAPRPRNRKPAPVSRPGLPAYFRGIGFSGRFSLRESSEKCVTPAWCHYSAVPPRVLPELGIIERFVIAGLDPAIHPLRRKSLRRVMDPRVTHVGA